MKRLLFFAAVLVILSCGIALAQLPGQNAFVKLGTVTIGGNPAVNDTLYLTADAEVKFPLIYGNRDTIRYNVSNAFIIFSDADGVPPTGAGPVRGDGTANWAFATANGGNVKGLGTGLGMWVDTTGFYHKSDFPSLYKFSLFGANGTGADTVQFSGAGGLDDTGYVTEAAHRQDSGIFCYLKIQAKLADTGKWICIDSSAKYPPSGTWKWPAFALDTAAHVPSYNVFPTWDGPWCFILWNPNSVGVDEVGDGSLPTKFDLAQNFPNPFNPSTVIKFDVPKKSHIKLVVYNVLGQKVSTLLDEEKAAGKYEARFDGSALSSGMYFYKLEADSYVSTKKMLLVK